MVSVVAILGVCCEKIFANFAELCGGEFSELSALWHSRSLLWFIVVVCDGEGVLEFSVSRYLWVIFFTGSSK